MNEEFKITERVRHYLVAEVRFELTEAEYSYMLKHTPEQLESEFLASNSGLRTPELTNKSVHLATSVAGLMKNDKIQKKQTNAKLLALRAVEAKRLKLAEETELWGTI